VETSAFRIIETFTGLIKLAVFLLRPNEKKGTTFPFSSGEASLGVGV
jgi:hypothetical protein